MFDIEQEQIDKRKRLLYLIKIHLPASLHGGMQFLVLALDQQIHQSLELRESFATGKRNPSTGIQVIIPFTQKDFHDLG